MYTRSSPHEHDVPSWPDRLGPFRLEREIGRGSFGVVYEAREVDTSSVMALKILRVPDGEGVASFKNEVRRVAHLHHPNIIVPLELLNIGSYWCFSMELVRGTDILSFVCGGPPEERLRRIRGAFGQLVSAIAALHAEGLVHLDLKPANVMVRQDGHVFVLDFGIAQTIHPRPRRPDAWPPGTPYYAAPELSRGSTPSPKCDWYSVGVMLYEALSGDFPSPEEPPGAPDLAHEHLRILSASLMATEPELRPSAEQILTVLRESSATRLPKRAKRLLGRDLELEELLVAQGRSREKGGSHVLLTGGPGVGKTSLVRRFSECVEDEVLRAAGRCYARETSPYKGIDEVIFDLASHAVRLPVAEQRTLLSDGIAEAARLFPVLERITGVRGSASTASDPHVLKRRAYSALRRLARSLSRRRPLVLFLDDAHWADPDTVTMWTEVFGDLSDAPITAILTFRADDAHVHEWRRNLLAHDARLVELALTPLDRSASEALARELSCESEKAALIAEAAGGNPFLIEELARDAPVDAAANDRDPIDDLVRLRLNGLTPAARQVLVLAALVARPVSQVTLFSAARAAQATHEVVSELHRASFVRTRSQPGMWWVELWHDRLRAPLLKTVDTLDLAPLHEALALSFEAHGEPPGETADHFLHAGRPAPALRYFAKAGDQARESFAFETAARYYEAAARTGVADESTRSRLELARAECLFNAGRCAESAPVFVSAADLDRSGGAHQRLRAADAWLVAGRIDEGLEVAARVADFSSTMASGGVRSNASLVLSLARLLLSGARSGTLAAAQSSLEGDLCWTLAKGLMYVMPLRATAFLVRALESALRNGDDFRVGRAMGLLGAGVFLQVPGLSAAGRKFLARAGSIAATRNDPYLRGMNSVWDAFADMYEGRWSAMLDKSERGRALLEHECVGVAWESVIAQGLSAWALQFMGRLRESGSYAAEALSSSIHRGDLYGEVLFSQYLAYSEIAAGEVDVARARVAAADAKWSTRDYTVSRFYATYLQAMCDLMQDRTCDARERLASESANFRRSGGRLAPMSRIDESLLRARVLLRDPLRRGSQELRRIARIMERERRADCGGHAAFIRAALAACEGRTRDARRWWSVSAERYARADMGLNAATARLRAGELARDGSAMSAATESMRQCGVARPDVWANAFMPSGVA